MKMEVLSILCRCKVLVIMGSDHSVALFFRPEWKADESRSKVMGPGGPKEDCGGEGCVVLPRDRI